MIPVILCIVFLSSAFQLPSSFSNMSSSVFIMWENTTSISIPVLVKGGRILVMHISIKVVTYHCRVQGKAWKKFLSWHGKVMQNGQNNEDM